MSAREMISLVIILLLNSSLSPYGGLRLSAKTPGNEHGIYLQFSCHYLVYWCRHHEGDSDMTIIEVQTKYRELISESPCLTSKRIFMLAFIYEASHLSTPTSGRAHLLSYTPPSLPKQHSYPSAPCSGR